MDRAREKTREIETCLGEGRKMNNSEQGREKWRLGNREVARGERKRIVLFR